MASFRWSYLFEICTQSERLDLVSHLINTTSSQETIGLETILLIAIRGSWFTKYNHLMSCIHYANALHVVIIYIVMLLAPLCCLHFAQTLTHTLSLLAPPLHSQTLALALLALLAFLLFYCLLEISHPCFNIPTTSKCFPQSLSTSNMRMMEWCFSAPATSECKQFKQI